MTTDSQHWHSTGALWFVFLFRTSTVRLLFVFELPFFLLLMFHYLIACCANQTTGSFNKQNVLALCELLLCFALGALCTYYSFSILFLCDVHMSHEFTKKRAQWASLFILQIKHFVGLLLHTYTKCIGRATVNECFDIYFTHSALILYAGTLMIEKKMLNFQSVDIICGPSSRNLIFFYIMNISKHRVFNQFHRIIYFIGLLSKSFSFFLFHSRISD